MSTTIDERIVSMKFNNGEFMKHSADTISALDRLKQGLDFKGAAKGLQGLDLASLASSVDSLRAKFEGFGAIATGVLLGIGNQLITTFGPRAIQSLTSNLIKGAKDGFGEYETQINGIQTIMSNTASKGTTIDQVNAALQELNKYADLTIYNFAEMTRNIGTFTAAGVDLDTSTAAIKGIANLAAMSGSTSAQASTAMYQLSQALAAGKVSLMDWNSVVNAGMGGQVFQDALKETARAQGIAIDDLIAKNGSFRESLQEGWLTAGVLTDTLAKFTGDLTKEQIINMGYTEQQAEEILALGRNASDAATKVKTFSQLVGTLNEAVGSGWAQSWQIIVGDFEEAKKLFTEVNDVLGGMIGAAADARNAQLQIWKDGDERGSGRDAVIQALRNSFQALMKVMTPIAEAWRAVFPPSLGKNLLEISFALRDFTAGLIISDGAANNLKSIFTGLFVVLKIGVTIIASVIRLFANTVGIVFKLAGAILGLLGPVITFVTALFPVSEGVSDAGSSIVWFTDLLINFQNFLTGPLIDALQNAGDRLDSFLNGGGARAAALKLIIAVLSLRDAIVSTYNILFKGDYTANPLFEEDSGWATNLFRIRDAVIALAQAAGSAFSILFKGDYTGNPLFSEDSAFADALFKIREGVIIATNAVKDFFGMVGEAGKRSISFWQGVGRVLSGIMDAIRPVVDAIKTAVSGFLSGLDFNTVMATLNSGFLVALVLIIRNAVKKISGIFESAGKLGGGLVDALEGVTGVLKAMQADLKANMILKIAAAIGILALSFVLLSTVDPQALQATAIAMGVIAAAIIGIMLVVEKMMQSSSAVESWTDTMKSSFTSITDSVKNNLNAAALVKAATALLILAAALVVMAFAIGMLAAIPTDRLVQGMIAITVALGLLVGTALVLDKLKNGIIGGSFAMMLMAAALNMLLIPITALGLIPIPMLVQGMVALGLVLGMLVLAMQNISAIGPKVAVAALGFLAMAVALNMLVIPITALGLLPIPVLVQGLVALGVILLMLTTVALTLGKIGPQMALAALGLMAMAAAVGQLVLPITALGSMDLPTLVQGILAVAAVLTVLVVAANAMTGAITGAGAMVLVAAALLVLAIAIGVLGSMPLETLIQGLIGMAAALIIVGVAGYALTGAIPGMLAVAVAVVLIAAGLLIMAAAVAVFAFAVLMLGPALISVTQGLLVFAGAADKLIATVPAMLAIGAGLLVFGAGAAVAGAGILILGVGILVLGVALALIGVVGVIGATALAAVVIQISKLLEHAPGILIMSGAFTVLGAALLVLGAGLLLVGTGALLTAVALAMLVPLGTLVSISLTLVMSAIQRAADKAASVQALVDALGPLGPAIAQIGSAGAAAAGGILAVSATFGVLAVAALLAGTSVVAMAGMMGVAIPTAINVISQSGIAFAAFVASVLMSIQMLQGGLAAAVPGLIATSTALARSITTNIINIVRGDMGAMQSAGYDVGYNMTLGMRSGIQNGSAGVAAAARSVAQSAMAAARSELDIHSPSRKMAVIGGQASAGLAQGQLDEVKTVTDASATVAKAAIKATQDTLARLKSSVATDMDLQPTIKPVLDLSNVRKGAAELKFSSPTAYATLDLTKTREQADAAYKSFEGEDGDDPSYTRGNGDTIIHATVNQTNNSPKALPRGEIYRDTESAISQLKNELGKRP